MLLGGQDGSGSDQAESLPGRARASATAAAIRACPSGVAWILSVLHSRGSTVTS